MPHSEILAWLSSATLKNFISDFDAVKSKFGLLIMKMTKKMKTSSKMKMTLKMKMTSKVKIT